LLGDKAPFVIGSRMVEHVEAVCRRKSKGGARKKEGEVGLYILTRKKPPFSTTHCIFTPHQGNSLFQQESRLVFPGDEVITGSCIREGSTLLPF
jgi:hypothetical protein